MPTLDLIPLAILAIPMLVAAIASTRAAARAAPAVPTTARRPLGRGALPAPVVALAVAAAVIVTAAGAPTEVRVAHALSAVGAWSLAGLAALAAAVGRAAGRLPTTGVVVAVAAGALAALATPLPLFERLAPAAIVVAPFVGLALVAATLHAAVDLRRRLAGAAPAPRRARVLTVLVLAVVLVPGGAAAVEAARGTSDAGRHPAPGTVHVVDGVRMHLACTGAGGPTVLLEAGHGGDSTSWAWVQRALEGQVRVCSYDRPGYGWSDYAAVARDPVASAHRAHGLLTAAGEPGPYVVVGHSLGGHLARAFASVAPDDTLAVVLVDPRHEDLPRLVTGYDDGVRATLRMLRLGVALGPLGALRLAGDTTGELEHLPEGLRAAAAARLVRTDHLRASYDELLAMDASDDAVRALPDLGDMPLLVISAGTPMAAFTDELWRHLGPLHDDLAAGSAAGRRVRVGDADHVSILTRAPHAQRVADEVIGLLGTLEAADR